MGEMSFFFYKNHKKSVITKNFSVWCFFKSARRVCNQSPVLQFDKNSTQNAYFLQKDEFCIFEHKNREVIENSSKAPLTLVH